MKRSFDTKTMALGQGGVIHLWLHLSHGLKLSEEDRNFVLLFLIARFKATGFVLIAIDVLKTHWHLLILAEGESLDAATLRERWDEAILGQLPKQENAGRILILCEASNDLGSTMKSLGISLTKRLNYRARKLSGQRRFGTWLSGSYECRLLNAQEAERARFDPVGALRIAISYVENNGVDAGLATTPAEDPCSGLGYAARSGQTIYPPEKAERLALLLAGNDAVERFKAELAPDAEVIPALCRFVQHQLTQICVGRSLRVAVERHCRSQGLEPQGQEATQLLSDLQYSLLKAHCAGSENEVRAALARIPAHHTRLRERLYHLPILGCTVLGTVPASIAPEALAS